MYKIILFACVTGLSLGQYPSRDYLPTQEESIKGLLPNGISSPNSGQYQANLVSLRNEVNGRNDQQTGSGFTDGNNRNQYNNPNFQNVHSSNTFQGVTNDIENARFQNLNNQNRPSNKYLFSPDAGAEHIISNDRGNNEEFQMNGPNSNSFFNGEGPNPQYYTNGRTPNNNEYFNEIRNAGRQNVGNGINPDNIFSTDFDSGRGSQTGGKYSNIENGNRNPNINTAGSRNSVINETLTEYRFGNGQSSLSDRNIINTNQGNVVIPESFNRNSNDEGIGKELNSIQNGPPGRITSGYTRKGNQQVRDYSTPGNQNNHYFQGNVGSGDPNSAAALFPSERVETDSGFPNGGIQSLDQGRSPQNEITRNIDGTAPNLPSSQSQSSRNRQYSISGTSDYDFKYDVYAPEFNVEYGHQESKVNDIARGTYYVLLPDGRRQTVEYTAGKDGYKPRITYSGGNRVEVNTGRRNSH